MGDGYERHFGLRARAFEPVFGAWPSELALEEIEPYLVERLRGVGWDGTPMLDLGLAPLLHEATGGNREAIDRAMTDLLESAAHKDARIVDGDGLVAWLDHDRQFSPRSNPVGGLAEAQIEAIEGAFSEQERKLSRLRRELSELRDGSTASAVPAALAERLDALEERVEQQEAALRHVLERLIVFFEGEAPLQP
jgi:hypothetical protein